MKKIMLAVLAAVALVATTAFAMEYKVGDHLGFDRAVTFHVEVRQVCYTDLARDFLAKEGKYELSKLAKKKAFKMPKEALPTTIVLEGFSKTVNHGGQGYQLVDRDNKFVAVAKPATSTDTKLSFAVVGMQDPAFAVRLPYASFDKGAKQKVVFITDGWKLADGTSSVEFDFTERVTERRTAMLQILFVDPSHPACK